MLSCNRCGKLVKTDEYTRHLSSNGETFSRPVLNSPSKVTLKDVLTRPVSTPATLMERKVTEHLVRRLLDESTGEVIKVSTPDQVGCTLLSILDLLLHNLHNNSTAPHPRASKQLSQIKCSCLHQNSDGGPLSSTKSVALAVEGTRQFSSRQSCGHCRKLRGRSCLDRLDSQLGSQLSKLRQ